MLTVAVTDPKDGVLTLVGRTVSLFAERMGRPGPKSAMDG